jgi:hypothetical protein
MHLGGDGDVFARTRRQRPISPCIKTARRYVEQSTQDPCQQGGLEESETRFGVAVLFVANQAAAFDKISCSILSGLSRATVTPVPDALQWSVRRRRNLHRALLTWAKLTRQLARLRPARSNSTIWRRNSGAYQFLIDAFLSLRI